MTDLAVALLWSVHLRQLDGDVSQELDGIVSQENTDEILPPERQRDLLLRYRDGGDEGAKAELMADLPACLHRTVEQAFGEEPAEVRSRITSAARQMLEGLVDHISLGPIRSGEGVDLIAEALDPDELEDELGSDATGKAALAALEARSGGGEDDEITRETAQDRTRIVGRISDLLLPVVRAHHLRGNFGQDFVQADVDRVSELALRAVSRISAMIRELPDRIILAYGEGEDGEEIENRIVADASLRSLIGFDPSEGFRVAKAGAARVAEKAAAAREESKRQSQERVRPTRTRSARAPTRRKAAQQPQRSTRTVLPPVAPKPQEPSVLDTMSRAEEEELMVTLRNHSMLWTRGNAIADPEKRDQYWDPVTAALEGSEVLVLRQMLALIRADRIRVERGLETEVERILKGKK